MNLKTTLYIEFINGIKLSKITVIIADDSALSRKIISDLLKEDKRIEIVSHAINGEEAINLVNEKNPDVLILDLLMPKVDGLKVLEKIMDSNPLPVIILSSINPKDLEASTQALLIGAFDYIIKPQKFGENEIPRFKKDLIRKINSAKKSKIKAESIQEKYIKNKISFRQQKINNIFKFGLYLNKIGSEIDSETEKIDITINNNINKVKEKSRGHKIKIKEIKKTEQTSNIDDEIKKDYKMVKISPHAGKNSKSNLKEKEPIEQTVPSTRAQKIKQSRSRGETRAVRKSGIIYEEDRSSHSQKITPVIKPLPKIKEPIIVMGASVGGPKTLKIVLEGLPRNFQAPILIVQHLHTLFVDSFTKNLNELCDINVKVAENNESIEKGNVYIAPSDKHMKINYKGGKAHIKTFEGQPLNHFMPSIDVLFRSAAKLGRQNVLGILLTGMGKDGVEGLGDIKKMGGISIAESKETCTLYGMPKIAIKKGFSTKELPNYRISTYIKRFVDEIN
ncbi:MAG: chemotaxis-specific protein-glutamate methyltransferase CheB [Candidatus Lokiarchaeota archaeon]|nr:chemotaxis-specific protein-glutamate methyltransferase CheB [Candidatus Lokiarchaeota archaeon]